ncbi:glycosyl hydrolase family 95 catalytic domain-containing protein [Novipirellula aureliae]|nr:hypothetical protein [Novipirellula aureliae]
MRTKKSEFLTSCCCLLVALGVSSIVTTKAGFAQESVDAKSIDWQAYLEPFDMRWDRLPKKWSEAPFLGNGEQGTLMYQLGPREIRFDVGCSAAHDHRPFEQDDLTEKHVEVLNRGRLTIGSLRLQLPADVVGGSARVNLWDAEATGVLESADGKVQWKSVVHATEPVIFVQWESAGNLKDTRIDFRTERAKNPRAFRGKNERQPPHPEPKSYVSEDGIQASIQDLVAGGQTAVAWKIDDAGPKHRIWLSVQHSYPDANAIDKAIAAVRIASSADNDSWLASHRVWWHEYYPQSFLSTGDGYWDSFYWVQQYKLACATRKNGWIIDNQGPWLQPTAWNAIWWNLNAQLSHQGGYQANRRGAVSALSHRIDVNQESLKLNVAAPYRHDSSALGRSVSNWDLLGHAGEPGGRDSMDRNIGRETANLLWALHNVDLEYRYWQDADLRDRVLLPVLIRAVNYYRHFLKEGDDGWLHLPQTHSPEYRNAADCSYDLDLLRWAVGRLIELSAERAWDEQQQPLLPEWKRIQAKLVPTWVDETGRMIGKGVPLTGGHRHWSHLLAVYPLRTLTPENPDDRQLIEKSVKHWRSFGRGIAGYSHSGSACIAAMLGDGDLALEYLSNLKPYVHPNTFYSEIGLPVMETPLHGATAVQEMLFQSWGGRLRCFPAVPSTWPDAQFVDFRGEGAFLVSALRRNGKTEWVEVVSTKGGKIELETGIHGGQFQIQGNAEVEELQDGVFLLKTSPGSVIRVASETASKESLFVPQVIPSRTDLFRFGLN